MINRNFLKILLICSSFLPLSLTYADSPRSTLPVTTYVLRITEQNAAKQAPLFGSYMTINNNQTYINPLINQQTPFETTVTTTALSTMVMSDAPIKIEVLEKKDGQLEPVLSGAGRSIVSLNDSGGVRSVYAK